MNRIAIIGISGSGKSTLSRELAEKTSLPLFHMDPLFWKGKWEAIPEVQTIAMHEELLKKDKWIIEGWVDEKMSHRLTLADLVIYLDYPGYLCAWRLIKRYFKHKKQSRPELPDEATEEFLPEYWWMVLNRRERDDIENAIKKTDENNVMRIHSQKQLREFLKKSLL